MHLHKIGYFYLIEGKKLVLNIANYINTGRYSTNVNNVNAPSLDNINYILKLNLPIKLTPEMQHTDLAKAFARLVKGRQIWVYDLLAEQEALGILINFEPFSSFGDAMQFIGYSRTSIAARRTLDTGKLVAGRYTFYSSFQL